MVGLQMEKVIGRGWGASAMYMLRTIVDPSIAYLSVNLFLVITCLNSMFTTQFVAFFVDKYNITPEQTPSDYGKLITLVTTLPLIICLPFFIYSGLTVRDVCRNMSLDKTKQNRNASMFIKSMHDQEDGIGCVS